MAAMVKVHYKRELYFGFCRTQQTLTIVKHLTQDILTWNKMKSFSILAILAFFALQVSAAPTEPPAEGEVYRCKSSTYACDHGICELLNLPVSQVLTLTKCAVENESLPLA